MPAGQDVVDSAAVVGSVINRFISLAGLQYEQTTVAAEIFTSASRRTGMQTNIFMPGIDDNIINPSEHVL